MGRIHLFEFEDQRWFPSFIRNYMTDFLQFLTNRTKLFEPVIPIIEKMLAKSNTRNIVDLGSGGGGGLIWISRALQKIDPEIEITMTDLYPNIQAFEYTLSKTENLKYISEPVDARKISGRFKGMRTMFLSMHHFRPEDAKSILQDAINSNQNIAIFEAQERSFKSIAAMLLSPVSVLLTTPFIRPVRLGRFLFTYIIPLVPIFVLWDGVVSSLRTYSIEEMENMIESLEGKESLSWEVGRIKSGPGEILYLTGTVNH